MKKSILALPLHLLLLFVWLVPGYTIAAELNLAPECSNASANPSSLWSPNHKFTDIAINGVTDPDGDPVNIIVQCILQDEEINATGDGNFIYDADGIDTSTASIRSERSGNNNGRVYHIDFIAIDSHGASCGGEVTVSVSHNKKKPAIDDGRLYQSVPSDNICGLYDVNNDPWIYSDPILTGATYESYTYDVDAHDPDQDVLSYSLVAGPSGLIIDTASGLLSWLSPESGIFAVTVRADDGRGGSDIQRYELFINGPPEIVSEPSLLHQVGTPYNYQVVAVDPNDDTLVYEIVDGPQSMLIDSTTGLIFWEVPVAGEHTVSIIVKDGRGASDTQSWSLFVNGPPEITSTPVIEHQTDSSYLYQVTAQDPNDDQLFYELLTAPQGIDIDANSGLLSWLEPLAGEFTISIQVSDGRGGSDQQNYSLFVNGPPVITSTPITEHQIGTPYKYQVVAVDPNNDELSYNLLTGQGGLAIDASTGLVSWAIPVPGEYALTVQVTDGHGRSDEQTYSLRVLSPPTIVAIADPSQIYKGDSSWLFWHTTYADTVSIDHGIGSVAIHGCFGDGVTNYSSEETNCGEAALVAPEVTTTYTLTANGQGGTVSTTVTVVVNEIPLPTVAIFATPQDISYGDTTQLKWHSTNAETITIDQGIGTVALNSNDEPGFAKVVTPESSTTYTITATGPGGTATDTVTVNVALVPPTVTLSAVPENITLGESTQLFWESSNAHSVEIDQEIGSVALNSSESFSQIITSPQSTTTYTITAIGPGGIATDSVTVNVETTPPPSVGLIAEPDNLLKGESTWLLWHSTNAEMLTIDQSVGSVGVNGCYGGETEYLSGISGECGEGRLVTPESTTVYTITATGPGGTVTDSVTVTVNDAPPPTVELVAIKENIIRGESSWLYWHSSNVDTVSIDQGINTVAENGCYGGEDAGFWGGAAEDCGEGKMVSPESSITYTITATGPGGSVTDSVTVTVEDPSPPTIELMAVPETIRIGDTSWLYWNSTNAEIVTISQGIGVVAANGCSGGEDEGLWPEGTEECGEGRPISPQVTTTYTIIAMGAGGIATDSVTVTVETVVPPTVEIVASPELIEPGNVSWLYWNSTNADTVTINQGIGGVAVNGCSGGEDEGLWPNGVTECGQGKLVSPQTTTTYTIIATGPGGTAVNSVTITVNFPPPTVEIFANPKNIESGDTSWLEWHSMNADTVTIDQGIGVVALNTCALLSDSMWDDIANFFVRDAIAAEFCEQKISISPTTTTTYTINATGPGGTATASVTVIVDSVYPPTVNFSTGPEESPTGNGSLLYWYSHDAETITIDQGIGVVALNDCNDYGGEVICEFDGLSVSPTTTTTYTITATGPGGSTTASVTVFVPRPFVYIFADPIKISSGDSSWIEWDTSNADTVSISPRIGVVEPDDCWEYEDDGSEDCWGEVEVTPALTTTYVVSATGQGGTVTDSVTIYVDEEPPLSVKIYSKSGEIVSGDRSRIYWESINAETLSIDPEIGIVALDDDCWESDGVVECWGRVNVFPTTTTTYTATATSPGGTATDSVTITVDGDEVPIADFYARSTSVFRGESTTLHWQTNSADEVSIDQGIGAVGLNSDEEGLLISPETTTTYTLTATGATGQGSLSVTVIVLELLPPIVDLIAWPDTLTLGRDSTLAWSSSSADTVVIEASVEPDIGEVALNIDIYGISVVPETTTTYTITATGPGGTATDSVTVKVLPKIDIINCDLPILAGDSCTISVHTINGETVSVDQGVGAIQMTPGTEYQHSGTLVVSPTEQTTYTVNATGNGGTSTATVTVNVAPKVEFLSNHEIIEFGSSAQLHWTTFQADTVFIRPDIGYVPLNSVPEGLAVSPATATTYEIIATGPTEDTSASLRVHVNDFSKPPVVNSFYASPIVIDPGDTATLVWETANMQEARINNGVGNVALYGAREVSPQRTTTYILTVGGPQGFTTEQVTVKVRGTYEPGSFAVKYENLLPDNNTIDIDGDHFSLLTGHCEDIEGNPIANVTTAIVGRPEFGTVLTDMQGRYTIPVTGNNRYTVALSKEGLLPVHRKTEVLNNKIAVVDTATLIEPDSLTTLIDFTTSPEPVFHGGQYVTDERGQRRLILTIPSGAISTAMDMVTTEYSTLSSLPAPLPPNTPYTFVAEIGNGQESSLPFTEPVIAWIDNFLTFTVGQTVPVGWYDRNVGRWIPQENGLVVQLLDTDNDGTVDALDIDGNQQADDLDGDGDYADEVVGLLLDEVQVGASYYRFSTDHSGVWAISMPYAPLEASAPAPLSPFDDLASCPSGECELVEQDVVIPGTELSLHYSEARVSAYQPKVTIPVTGESIPDGVEEILVKMTVAGKVYEELLNPEPNQTIQFQWDGRDHLDQEVIGPITAEIAIGYVYDRNYALAGGFSHAFGQAGFGDVAIASREKYIAWHRDRLQLNRLTESDDFIADGWTLSVQHQVNTNGLASIHFGSGGVEALQDQWFSDAILQSNLGFGVIWEIRDVYYRVRSGTFGNHSGIAVDDATDQLYWSNAGFNVINRIDINKGFDMAKDRGLPPVFAGNYSPDSEDIVGPVGISIDDFGNIFYADSGNQVIRSGNREYPIQQNYHLFAGNGQADYFGDGGPAIDAAFNVPGQLTLDHWGNTYIIDRENHVIRKISPLGIVETIAGNGILGSDGDNGHALAASISPRDIAVDGWGNIFLAEPDYNRVRKINVSGIITTVAGTGTKGVLGEEGPAVLAQLKNPVSVAVNSLGQLYIGDYNRLLEVGDDLLLRKISYFSTVGVMTTDMQDRIFLNDPYVGNVYKVAPPNFADMYDGAFYDFLDSTGQHHYFSGIGQHLYTGSLTAPTYSFIYDLDNFFVAVHDASGNDIVTIHRDENGRVMSLETAEGETTLSINDDNHLVEILTPANDSVIMEYSEQGLLTEFEATFTAGIQGVVTSSFNGEPLGSVAVNLITAQGSRLSQTDANGFYDFSNVEIGEYSLEFHRAGYFDQAVTGSILFGSKELTHNIPMLAYPALELSIDSPQNNAILPSSNVQITGQVSNSAIVTVNGKRAVVTGTQFSVYLSLNGEGQQTVTVEAADSYGQQTSVDMNVFYYPPPSVTLTTSSDLLQLGTEAILSWNSENSDHCELEPLMLNVDCSGSLTISPSKTTIYTVRATGLGGSAVANATITVLQPPAIVFTVSPEIIQEGDTAILSWNVTDAVSINIDNGIGSVGSNGSVVLSPDTTTIYTMNADGPGGNATAEVTLGVQALLSLSINSPAPFITVNVPEISVSGSFTNLSGNETGIVANGIPGQVNGNEFFVNSVSLIEGENTISVTAVDTIGNKAVETVTVFLDSSVEKDWIELNLSADSGIAPFATTLTVEYHLSFSPTEAPRISYSGPDLPEMTWESATESNFTFSTPGIYTLFCALDDPEGNEIQQEIKVNVLDRVELDTLLQAKWDGMKENLLLNQIDNALAFFLESSQAVYKNQFEFIANAGVLPQVVYNMGLFRMVEHDGYGIIYDLRTFRDDVEYSFQVLFVQDMDGIWRIKNY